MRVCATQTWRFYRVMGFHGVLGHEFVGRVEEIVVSSSSSLLLKEKWLGKRVCGDINVGCANCDVCHNCCGLDNDDDNASSCCPQMSRNHCPKRTVLGILGKNGTMAE
mmetsp:Transcript_19781/g.19012  ORF Transcript_19781/g.19012 Transcript_19781/m.19012 type:complete len:108 (-) Transcript_19781:334-657(-)